MRMSTDIVCSVEEIAALVPSAAKLAIVKEPSGMALAATLAIARRGVRDLHLVCVPVGGLAADILIGAGCVATIETSAVSLGEFGAAPRFTHAVRTGDIKILDATCPAIYAALQAAEKGVPFLPLRGLIGSDVLAHRVDWKVIDNPFLLGDKIAVVAAIRPDIALFHVPLADRFGNVFIGRDRELMLMAHASQATLVTAERIVEEDLLKNEAMAGAVIPALYVSRIALAPRGAWPLGLADRYPEDERALADYAAEAKTADGFQRVIASWSDGVPEGELSAA
jgi:glutaconate CoA-transferase, subunit A